MSTESLKASEVTEPIIGAAIEVHRELGPGLMEGIYERCFLHELHLRGLSVEKQRTVPIRYKGMLFAEELRFDVLVGNQVLVELKSVHELLPIHTAQVLTYMRLLGIPVGLLINFNQPRLIDGVRRLILPFPQVP